MGRSAITRSTPIRISRSLWAPVVALSFSSPGWSMPGPVDLRNVNLAGTVTAISAPNILQVQTTQQGKRRRLWIELADVDFGPERGQTCDHSNRSPRDDRDKTLSARVKNACWRLRHWLKDKVVSLEIVDWTQPVLKGYVIHNHTIVNHAMISRGWYRVDHAQSRAAPLVQLERTARCQRVGRWKTQVHGLATTGC